MLPSRAAGDEVRFECNVHALAVDSSQKAYATVGIRGIMDQQTISNNDM
jgi:hypothetical protein